MMNKEPLKENTIPMYMRLSFRIFILLLLFWILTYEVLTWWTASMDESVYSWIMNTFSSNFTEVFIAFTNIWGTYWVIILTLILTSIFAFKKGYRKYAILTLSTPIIIYLLNTIIKNIIQRPRPDILRLISETWYSFPSWHTMHTVALYW
jgi:undecaprenyl-diphosphatase